jgi:tRNA pseudouridine13 synthase
MKLKVRPNDFQVTELLREGLLAEHGAHRVYRVTKRKMTSLEAASELARRAGVTPGEVAIAGLKDRQGVTHQYMSVPSGHVVHVHGSDLAIHPVGALARPLASDDSEGNAFKIVVRDLGDAELARMRASLDAVRQHGLPNYFDEQRFGNLRHGQGWIFVDLARGDVSEALRRLLASASPHDTAEVRRVKAAMWRKWGDWRACRELAGKLGRHHSVFEHLKREPDDFVGGLHRVGSRERLIHLFAFQSHLWNRALSNWLANHARDSFTLRGVEGKLIMPRGAVPLPEGWAGVLPLPGPGLDGVEDPDQRAAFEAALSFHGLAPHQLAVDGVPGFQLAAEPRAAVVVPRELRMRPAKEDSLYPGRHQVELSFSLPRGSYATLVVRRLVGPRPTFGPEGEASRPPRGRHDAGGEGPWRPAPRRGFGPRTPRRTRGGGPRRGSRR